MSRVRRLLIAERGIALPASIAVLAILSLLAAAIAAAAIRVSSKSTRDHDSRRALSAAEAGFQVARYRLNHVRPGADMCLTDRAVAPGTSPAAAGECPPATGNVGANASYAYYVTPVVTIAGYPCGGDAVSLSATVSQRCITSVGSANGVQQRVQALVEAPYGTPLFPFSGILGLDYVNVNQNGFGDLEGKVGSNGNLTIKSCKTSGSASRVTWDPGPGGTLSNSCSGTIQQATPTRTQPWTLDGIDDLIGSPNTADPANNDNIAVFSGRSDFQYTYDPAGNKRELKDAADANLVLNGPNTRSGSGGIWTFNFCKLTLTHKTKITLQNGAAARFFIDSSERNGSNCGTTGSLTVTNVSYMNYDPAATPPGDPTLLQFMVYGTATIAISNQSGFAAALYAPRAGVKVTNKTTWYGALAASWVEATNGLDFHPGDVSGITRGSGPQTYSRREWVECTSAPPNPSDPESGC